MEAKEKAEELFNKYCIYLRAGLLYDDEARQDAKECALIAVDEILNLCWGGNKVGMKHWNEVKQEIEKIII
jgi:hypothetical protein